MKINQVQTERGILRKKKSTGSIYNESGVWRFRELLNFCEIETEDIEQCSKYLVSLDGAEGRQSKPYHMSKVAEFVGLDNENVVFQPEGYNQVDRLKIMRMSAAVTHGKMMGAKIICASTGNTSASAGMFAANENMECDVYIPDGQIAQEN